MSRRPMPAAEVEVSAGLVRRLLAAQHPDLAPLPVTVLANGWDNVLCRIGPDLIARLPRRAAAVQLIRHELALAARARPPAPAAGPRAGADRAPRPGLPVAVEHRAVPARPGGLVRAPG